MIEIVASDRAGADDLSEIVNLIRDAVVAARPDTEVDRDAVAPEDRMRVDVRRARVTGDIARII